MRFRKSKSLAWNTSSTGIEPDWYQNASHLTTNRERSQQHFAVSKALSEVLEAMYASVATRVGYQIFDISDPLWQYRSISGLEGMLSSDELWTTATTHLNDTTEFDYGRQLFLKHLDQIGSVQTDAWKDVLPIVRKRLANLHSSDVFVTCFSQNGDDRTLWGLYGFEGEGYAIGFDPKRHAELRPRTLVAKVLYDPDLQDRFCEELIKSGMNVIFQLMEENNTADANRKNIAIFCLRMICDLMIPAIKHPSFLDEKESRYFTSIKYDPLCKDSVFCPPGLTVPRIPLKWNGKLPISEIVIGPLHDFEAEKARLKALAESHGYFGIDFKRSNVPLKRT